MQKILVAVLLSIFVIVSGCSNEKDNKQNERVYEVIDIKHQSLRGEYTWLEQISETAGNTKMFDSLNIQQERYSEQMTLEEFVKKGWYIQEYSILTDYEYKAKEDIIPELDMNQSADKTFEFLDFIYDIENDACRFLTYYPETNDIIYVIVCRNQGEKWRDSYICGYEYYWNMTKEDSFSINGITQSMSQKEIDKTLLISEGNYAKAEYDEQDRIENVYYTNQSAGDGVRIQYHYRNVYSDIEPYEKIVTVSVRQ